VQMWHKQYDKPRDKKAPPRFKEQLLDYLAD
jgi:hypothetical protein